MTLAAAPANFQVIALSASSPKELDPQTWAENLTKQYDALEKLYEQYRSQGFEVLGFPANDFKAQEPGSDSAAHPATPISIKVVNSFFL